MSRKDIEELIKQFQEAGKDAPERVVVERPLFNQALEALGRLEQALDNRPSLIKKLNEKITKLESELEIMRNETRVNELEKKVQRLEGELQRSYATKNFTLKNGLLEIEKAYRDFINSSPAVQSLWDEVTLLLVEDKESLPQHILARRNQHAALRQTGDHHPITNGGSVSVSIGGVDTANQSVADSPLGAPAGVAAEPSEGQQSTSYVQQQVDKFKDYTFTPGPHDPHDPNHPANLYGPGYHHLYFPGATPLHSIGGGQPDARATDIVDDKPTRLENMSQLRGQYDDGTGAPLPAGFMAPHWGPLMPDPSPLRPVSLFSTGGTVVARAPDASYVDACREELSTSLDQLRALFAQYDWAPTPLMGGGGAGNAAAQEQTNGGRPRVVPDASAFNTMADSLQVSVEKLREYFAQMHWAPGTGAAGAGGDPAAAPAAAAVIPDARYFDAQAEVILASVQRFRQQFQEAAEAAAAAAAAEAAAAGNTADSGAAAAGGKPVIVPDARYFETQADAIAASVDALLRLYERSSGGALTPSGLAGLSQGPWPAGSAYPGARTAAGAGAGALVPDARAGEALQDDADAAVQPLIDLFSSFMAHLQATRGSAGASGPWPIAPWMGRPGAGSAAAAGAGAGEAGEVARTPEEEQQLQYQDMLRMFAQYARAWPAAAAAAALARRGSSATPGRASSTTLLPLPPPSSLSRPSSLAEMASGAGARTPSAFGPGWTTTASAAGTPAAATAARTPVPTLVRCRVGVEKVDNGEERVRVRLVSLEPLPADLRRASGLAGPSVASVAEPSVRLRIAVATGEDGQERVSIRLTPVPSVPADRRAADAVFGSPASRSSPDLSAFATAATTAAAAVSGGPSVAGQASSAFGSPASPPMGPSAVSSSAASQPTAAIAAASGPNPPPVRPAPSTPMEVLLASLESRHGQGLATSPEAVAVWRDLLRLLGVDPHSRPLPGAGGAEAGAETPGASHRGSRSALNAGASPFVPPQRQTPAAGGAEAAGGVEAGEEAGSPPGGSSRSQLNIGASPFTPTPRTQPAAASGRGEAATVDGPAGAAAVVAGAATVSGLAGFEASQAAATSVSDLGSRFDGHGPSGQTGEPEPQEGDAVASHGGIGEVDAPTEGPHTLPAAAGADGAESQARALGAGDALGDAGVVAPIATEAASAGSQEQGTTASSGGIDAQAEPAPVLTALEAPRRAEEISESHGLEPSAAAPYAHGEAEGPGDALADPGPADAADQSQLEAVANDGAALQAADLQVVAEPRVEETVADDGPGLVVGGVRFQITLSEITPVEDDAAAAKNAALSPSASSAALQAQGEQQPQLVQFRAHVVEAGIDAAAVAAAEEEMAQLRQVRHSLSEQLAATQDLVLHLNRQLKTALESREDLAARAERLAADLHAALADAREARDESDAFMRDLVETKVQLAEVQGEYMQVYQALKRALGNEKDMMAKIDELERILAVVGPGDVSVDDEYVSTVGQASATVTPREAVGRAPSHAQTPMTAPGGWGMGMGWSFGGDHGHGHAPQSTSKLEASGSGRAGETGSRGLGRGSRGMSYEGRSRSTGSGGGGSSGGGSGVGAAGDAQGGIKPAVIHEQS